MNERVNELASEQEITTAKCQADREDLRDIATAREFIPPIRSFFEHLYKGARPSIRCAIFGGIDVLFGATWPVLVLVEIESMLMQSC